MDPIGTYHDPNHGKAVTENDWANKFIYIYFWTTGNADTVTNYSTNGESPVTEMANIDIFTLSSVQRLVL